MSCKDSLKLSAEQKRVCYALIVFFLMMAGAFFGFFFGFIYPEKYIIEHHIETKCLVVEQKAGDDKCCLKSCSCKSCGLDPECSTLQSSKLSGDCCGGEACCGTCAGVGSACCFFVTHQKCTISCTDCWKPTTTYQFTTNVGQNITFISSIDCKSDYSCVEQFVSTHFVGESVTCFYDPTNPSENVLFKVGYQPVHFGLLAIASLAMIAIIISVIVFIIKRTVIQQNSSC